MFTADAGGGFFIITEIAVLTTAAPGSGAASFTFSAGSNASSYDNIVSSQTASVSMVNGVTMVRPTSFIAVLAASNCYLNVTSASGSGAAAQVFVTGYYQYP